MIPHSGISQFVVHAGEGRITGTLSPLSSQTCRIWVDIGGTMTDKWRVQWEWRIDKYVVIAAACEADTSSTVWGT